VQRDCTPPAGWRGGWPWCHGAGWLVIDPPRHCFRSYNLGAGTPWPPMPSGPAQPTTCGGRKRPRCGISGTKVFPRPECGTGVLGCPSPRSPFLPAGVGALWRRAMGGAIPGHSAGASSGQVTVWLGSVPWPPPRPTMADPARPAVGGACIVERWAPPEPACKRPKKTRPRVGKTTRAPAPCWSGGRGPGPQPVSQTATPPTNPLRLTVPPPAPEKLRVPGTELESDGRTEKRRGDHGRAAGNRFFFAARSDGPGAVFSPPGVRGALSTRGRGVATECLGRKLGKWQPGGHPFLPEGPAGCQNCPPWVLPRSRRGGPLGVSKC